jgi:hypothetical protein
LKFEDRREIGGYTKATSGFVCRGYPGSAACSLAWVFMLVKGKRSTNSCYDLYLGRVLASLSPASSVAKLLPNLTTSHSREQYFCVFRGDKSRSNFLCFLLGHIPSYVDRTDRSINPWCSIRSLPLMPIRQQARCLVEYFRNASVQFNFLRLTATTVNTDVACQGSSREKAIGYVSHTTCFGVLTPIATISTIFCDMTPCSSK